MEQPGGNEASIDAQKEKARTFEAYIKKGLGLILHGKFYEAERYFMNGSEVGVEISLGEFQNIPFIRSKKELLSALDKVARASRPFEFPCYGFLSYTKEMEDMPEAYEPKLLQEFRYEVAVICAEEWLHMLQEMLDGKVAGENDTETDVAIYLEKAGLYLSDHFVTRYQTRMDWFLAKHPEREAGVREFLKKIDLKPAP